MCERVKKDRNKRKEKKSVRETEKKIIYKYIRVRIQRNTLIYNILYFFSEAICIKREGEKTITISGLKCRFKRELGGFKKEEWEGKINGSGEGWKETWEKDFERAKGVEGEGK